MVDDGRPLVLIIVVTRLFVAFADDEEEEFESCCEASAAVPGELFNMDDVLALAEPP